MTDAITVIQARTGSSRLPGKSMYPLDGYPVLAHVIRRVKAAERTGTTIVATTDNRRDDVIAEFAPRYGAAIHRGSESNVLRRLYRASREYEPDSIVRVTADCPLLSPAFLDRAINRIATTDVDYVSAGINRTFPRGVTAEAFTADSFTTVYEHSTEPRHREHVTPYYREHPEQFDLHNVRSEDVYDSELLQNRSDLRLTLDEAADYELLEKIYSDVAYDGVLELRDAIAYIDRNGLGAVNEHVTQKSIE